LRGFDRFREQANAFKAKRWSVIEFMMFLIIRLFYHKKRYIAFPTWRLKECEYVAVNTYFWNEAKGIINKTRKNSKALVGKRSIPNERPPLVGEVNLCGLVVRVPG
jgi:hypothetical protein